MLDVLVIGAGLSGMTAAHVLRERGADVLLIEADAQVGGRIRSLRDQRTNRTLADLGPTWVWPKYQPTFAKWANSLGIETFEQFNQGDAVVHGYSPKPIRQTLPGQDGITRVVGGPTSLIKALCKPMDPACIRTATNVTGIREGTAKKVSVHIDTGEKIEADHVVISVPLRIAAANLEMPWASPELLDAMRRAPTWMSTHAKAVVIYNKPFWRNRGLAGRIVSRTGPLVEAHDHSGVDGTPAAIFGFVGWSPAIRQSDPERLRKAILRQLVECFGQAAAKPEEFFIQDWAKNRKIVSDLDLSEPASHPNVGPEVLRQAHLGGSVRFSVSETSKISPGLIEGALAAGEQTAKQLLADEPDGTQTSPEEYFRTRK